VHGSHFLHFTFVVLSCAPLPTLSSATGIGGMGMEAHQLQIDYPGAVHHVMSLGDWFLFHSVFATALSHVVPQSVVPNLQHDNLAFSPPSRANGFNRKSANDLTPIFIQPNRDESALAI
jgi:hypothetical protein